MKCPNNNCNTENPSNARFCNQCGYKFNTLKKCPYPDCGKEGLPVMAKYCPDCGRLLDATEFVTPEDKKKKQFEVPEGMIFVEGGSFEMGNDEYNDNPEHTVVLNDFYIGKYPVTQSEWEDIMEDNPSSTEGENMPVTDVTWFDCVEFCNALSKAHGYEPCYKINGEDVKWIKGRCGYRLPTEAEWEFAARGGNESCGYTYAGSDDIDEVACYDENGNELQEVGELEPNELGVYDMSGNIDEWCWDWCEEDYYASSPKKNPTGPATGSDRVFRGGGWYGAAGRCTVSHRDGSAPDYSCNDLGFRLAFACSSK